MKFDKNDIVALVGSLIFHLILFLILFFTVLKTVIPEEEEEGVLVNFGNVNLSAGVFEPQGRGTPNEDVVPTPEAVIPPSSSDQRRATENEMITQDTEETVSLSNKQKEAERRRREDEERRERERIEGERRRQEEERRRREQAIRDRVSGAFGSGNSDTDNQGSATTGSGNEGSPFGNSDSGANEGVGGFGSFNLNGRSIGAGGLPRPAYTIQEEGKIVINITVDPKGHVILAEIGRGTNIDNASMRASALEAAKRAKFNSIQSSNNQSGTITYRYSLK